LKHFSIWQWADYVRGLGDDDRRSAMDAHLSSGCPRCARTVRAFRSMVSIASGEVAHEPPEHAIRYAQAVYSLFRPQTTSLPKLAARLVYDSRREPLPAGLRAHHRLSRHALYEAGRYYLDLQLEQPLASGPVTLVGQLADRHQPSVDTAVPVWLMKQKTIVASTLCNRFGEFQLEYTPARDLRLYVAIRSANRHLDVPLNRLIPDISAPRRRTAATHRKATRRQRPG
jgi:hypothetical protein